MKDKDFAQKVINNILKNNIALKESEKILIFTDDCKRCEDITANSNLFEIALLFTECSKNFTSKVNFTYYPSLCGHGKEPPDELWEIVFGEDVIKDLNRKKLFKKIIDKTINEKEKKLVYEVVKKAKEVPDVVIALPYYSTSHTLFRKLLTEIFGTRYCSMPLFKEEMFYTALQEDLSILKKRAEFLKEKLKGAETVIIKADNGTYLRFSVKNREFIEDTGDLTFKGAFSNLPAGEVFIAPVEGTADGKIVIEYAPTFKLESPLTLWLSNGEVVHIQGDNSFKKELNTKFSQGENNNKLAEFGIGINTQAMDYFNILEAEKIYGTIHLAFGDNSSFGGNLKANFHEDYIISKPTVEIFFSKFNSIKIIDNGKPIF